MKWERQGGRRDGKVEGECSFKVQDKSFNDLLYLEGRAKMSNCRRIENHCICRNRHRTQVLMGRRQKCWAGLFAQAKLRRETWGKSSAISSWAADSWDRFPVNLTDTNMTAQRKDAGFTGTRDGAIFLCRNTVYMNYREKVWQPKQLYRTNLFKTNSCFLYSELGWITKTHSDWFSF